MGEQTVKPCDEAQFTNLGHIIETLQRWQMEGVPQDCLVFIVRDGDWLDVSNIRANELLAVVDGWRRFIVQECFN